MTKCDILNQLTNFACLCLHFLLKLLTLVSNSSHLTFQYSLHIIHSFTIWNSVSNSLTSYTHSSPPSSTQPASGCFTAESTDLVVEHPLLSDRDAALASECSKPRRDCCSIYLDCFENWYKCGSASYPFGYGKKLCQKKFSDDRVQLSEWAQEWMLDTM